MPGAATSGGESEQQLTGELYEKAGQHGFDPKPVMAYIEETSARAVALLEQGGATDQDTARRRLLLLESPVSSQLRHIVALLAWAGRLGKEQRTVLASAAASLVILDRAGVAHLAAHARQMADVAEADLRRLEHIVGDNQVREHLAARGLVATCEPLEDAGLLVDGVPTRTGLAVLRAWRCLGPRPQ